MTTTITLPTGPATRGTTTDSRAGRRRFLSFRSWAAVAVALAAAASVAVRPTAAFGHDIPDEIRIPVFVRDAGGEVSLVARVPLLLLLSLDVPKRGAGFLDLERAESSLRRGAEAFAREAPLFHPDGSLLPWTLRRFRVALPWDRSFTSFDAALETVRSAPLPPDAQVFWNQGFLDLHLTYPKPETGSVAVECRVAPGFGERVALDIIHEQPTGEDGAIESRLYHVSVREGRVVLDPSGFQAARAFLRSGVEHILTGWDHLLFLVCLIAPFGRVEMVRRLLLVVTGFTVAHSVTLVSAALGYAPSAGWFPPLVETAVALSIVYTAIENFFEVGVLRRALLALGFGLFHGFGFAFALGESLAFAGEHIPLALFSFNLGVEVGQVAVVLAVMPLLSLAERHRRAVTATLSILAGLLAWSLAGDRLSELRNAWILAGNRPPEWSWLLAPLAVAGVFGWVAVFRRRTRA